MRSAQRLTELELRILQLAADGKSNPEIADEIGYSVTYLAGGSRSLLAQMYRKMGVTGNGHRKAEAVAKALREGLIV